MKTPLKYDLSGNSEGVYELGSSGRVLQNKLGICSKREMEQKETELQLNAFSKFANIFGKEHRFLSEDLCRMHQEWLGKIYSWAGKYRTVNLAKGNFQFAAAKQIPKLMKLFEKEILSEYTPCLFSSKEEIAQALAVVHVEFILIHPFREGNGRLARILSQYMALQAGLPTLDFGTIKGKKREEYFKAVRAGLDKNYHPMAKIFLEIIKGG